MTKGKWPGLELCLRAGPKWGVSPSTSLQHSPAPCSAEGEHPVFLITSHMCEVKGNERGMRHKSHHHSTFTRQVGLSYNSHQCLTKWLNCDMFCLIAFEFIDVNHDGSLWLRPEASQCSEILLRACLLSSMITARVLRWSVPLSCWYREWRRFQLTKMFSGI